MRISLGTSRRGAAAAPLAVLLAVLIGLAATGCGESEGAGDTTIAVVGYSVPESLYEDVLEPAFQKTPEGEGVSFSNSFGASGDQSRAVVAGKEASVVHFAEVGDMERLVEAGLVSPEWDGPPDDGMGQNSAVAIAFRKGNPKGVRTLNHLLTKDVEIVTPNPSRSGSARWNIMAIWGALIHQGYSRQEILDAIKTVLEKTVVQPRSARDAMTAFKQGKGDVLLTYESEAINAAKEDEGIDYVVPVRTLLVATPIAFTKGAPPEAEAFVEWIKTEEAQELLMANGYRPIHTSMIGAKFPTPPDYYGIWEFGNWKRVNEELFDEKTGAITKIEEELGVPTGG